MIRASATRGPAIVCTLASKSSASTTRSADASAAIAFASSRENSSRPNPTRVERSSIPRVSASAPKDGSAPARACAEAPAVPEDRGRAWEAALADCRSQRGRCPFARRSFRRHDRRAAARGR